MAAAPCSGMVLASPNRTAAHHPSYCPVGPSQPADFHAYRNRLRHQLFGGCRPHRRGTDPGALRRRRAVPHGRLFSGAGARSVQLPADASAGGAARISAAPGTPATATARFRRHGTRTDATGTQRGRTAQRSPARSTAAMDGRPDAGHRRFGGQLPARTVRRGGGGGLPGKWWRQPDRIAEIHVRLSSRSAGAQGHRAYRHAHSGTHPSHGEPPVQDARARRRHRSTGRIPQFDGGAGVTSSDRDSAGVGSRRRFR